MRNKKKTGSEKTPEQEALEQRVDAMMDPKKPDENETETPAEAASPLPAKKSPVKSPGPAAAETAKTAPQLSAKLRKQISINDTSAEPLLLDKLDKLTKDFVGPETPAQPEKAAEPDTEVSPETKTADADEVTGQSEAEPDTPEPGSGQDEPKPDEPDETADEEVSFGEPPLPDELAEQSTNIEDARLDEAVEDIVAYESDVMLAIADSTAAERNRQVTTTVKKGRHPVLNVIIWTLVLAVVIVAAVLGWLLVTGGNLPGQ